MKRIATSIVSVVLAVGALAPAAGASDQSRVVYAGSGSARALDLSLPVLNALPLVGGLVSGLADFKGLTVGVTSAQFGSDPKVSGFAIGNCSILPANLGSLPALPVDLPCSKQAVESSSAPGDQGGDGTATCATNLNLAVVTVQTSCANSVSRIENGRPVSVNEGGVAAINVGLDLKPLLGIDVQGTVNSLTDTVSNLLTTVIGTVDGITKPILPIDLKTTVENALKLVTGLNLGKLATIQVGSASTTVGSSGSVTTITSEADGAKIGLLGISDALKDGLIMIDVRGSKAIASWDNATGVASSSAEPAAAVIKVKDLLDLVPGDYLTAVVDLSLLNSLLAPLTNTILDSSIEVASATPAQTGTSVQATTSGVSVRLLRGLGESSPGARDGGLVVRVAAADARIAGDVVQAESVQTIDAPLPHTGGPTGLYLAVASLMAVAAAFSFRFSRKVGSSSGA